MTAGRRPGSTRGLVAAVVVTYALAGTLFFLAGYAVGRLIL